MLCVKNLSLTDLVKQRMQAFPASGEINNTLDNAKEAIEKIRKAYESEVSSTDFTDGVSIEFDDWRFNLRSSNTEPVVRLNVESKNNAKLMNDKTSEILDLMLGK